MFFPQLPSDRMDPHASGITVFNPRAKPLFERARFYAQLNVYIAWVTRRPRKLLSLADTVRSFQSDVPTSNQIRTISIREIRGSVDRSIDFDSDFYPLNDSLCDRWVRLASMMLQGMPLPPVDLVQVGQYYFVVDGHHRISVARMLHHESVDTVITKKYDE